MKSLIALFFLAASICSAQKVTISDKEGNRPLVWSDFTGKPDNSSPYFANTYWRSNFSYSGVKFNGDAAILENFQFNLELDPKGSWVKEGKQTEDLLKHEQGHFTIGLLCMKEALEKIKSASFTKVNVQSEVRTILSDIHKKYHDMGEQYDKETAHSANKDEQAKWDAFFKKEL